MPISLPPIDRRGFLAGSAAAGASALLGRSAAAADRKADPHRFALFADTHVSGKRDTVVRGTNMYENMMQAGIHLINLPPVAYTFAKDKPNGWVDVQLGEKGATFELRCIDPKHPQHGEQFDLKWRA